ncbi:MAG: hypothetical protein ACRDJC_04670 [Thermomicrobiales bacterium]
MRRRQPRRPRLDARGSAPSRHPLADRAVASPGESGGEGGFNSGEDAGGGFAGAGDGGNGGGGGPGSGRGDGDSRQTRFGADKTMDGSQFDTWTRRRFGLETGGALLLPIRMGRLRGGRRVLRW